MAGQILTCDQIRACENRAVAEGISLSELMKRAGKACAQVLQSRHPSGRVVVLAGPGNNGGDAFVAARELKDIGRDVVVFELAPSGPRTPEGAEASAAWTGPRAPLAGFDLAPDDVVLDGLFGAGLSRPLDGDAARAVEIIGKSRSPVVAIDVPSGVTGDAGKPAGPAMQATDTVTFGTKKPAHVLQPAASFCGRVHVMEIGFGPYVGEVGQDRLRENGWNLWIDQLPWPEALSHKHQRGRLCVVTGPANATGAARLAAYAGLRVGAGMVTLLCPPDAIGVVAAAVTAPLTSVFQAPGDLVKLSENAGAVVIGPAAGVGKATRENIEALAGARRRLVLDADALSVFAGDVDALAKLLQADAVLTPHTGEFERLFPGLLGGARSKIEAARTAAAVSGATVVLKGPDTVVAAPDGRAVVNTHATPFLATAGSGDVLAGIVGGLMAQGLDAFTAASVAVWMHGDAGIKAGPGMTAEDLDAALRQTIASLYAARQ